MEGQNDDLELKQFAIDREQQEIKQSLANKEKPAAIQKTKEDISISAAVAAPPSATEKKTAALPPSCPLSELTAGVGIPAAKSDLKPAAKPLDVPPAATGIPAAKSDDFVKKHIHAQEQKKKDYNSDNDKYDKLEGGYRRASDCSTVVFNGVMDLPQDGDEFQSHNRPQGQPANPGAFPVGSHSTEFFRDSTLSVPDPNQLRNSQLAVANPIAEDLGLEELQRAEEFGSRAKEKLLALNRRFHLFGLMILLGVVAIVAVVVAVAMSQGSSESDAKRTGLTDVTPTQAPTLGTTVDPNEKAILSLLPPSSVEAVQKPGTPQAMACDWLTKDPNFSSYPSWRIVQRYAMAVFYHSTGGPSWVNDTHWMSYEHHECQWFSSTNGEEVLEKLRTWYIVKSEAVSETVEEQILNGTVCGSPDPAEWQYPATGSLQSLRLLKNNVTGFLPDDLYLISTLRSIVFFNNPIEGTISSEIGNLRELEILYGTETLLSGSLPTETGLLSNLNTLELFSNSLSGPIPSQLGLLSGLTRIILDTNQLTGTVPTELAKLQALHSLYLHSNDLVGTLPTELGLLDNLYDLQIHTTSISGTIPTEYFDMPQLGKLLIRRNLLTGTIPTEVSRFQSAWWIDFWDNRLVGTIPSQAGLLPTLKFWFSNENQITGTLPTEFGNLAHNLTRLYLANSPYGGPLPSELGLCTKMEMLWLTNNNFTGDVTQLFQAMTPLSYLQLNGNNFSGSIPTQVGLLTDLRWLEADSNSFTGTLPSQLGNLVGMGRLDLPNNNFHGTLPVEVANLTLGKLGLLDLTGNPLLSGTIPNAFCESSHYEHGQATFDCTEQLCGCECSCTNI